MSIGRRLFLFDRGSAAFARFAPDQIAIYQCPLCLRAFGRDAAESGELTEEHVPPKSIGGVSLVLTCRRCNNIHGTRLDAELAKLETQRSFLAGQCADLRKVLIRTRDGLRINSLARNSDGLIEVVAYRERNHPAVEKEFNDYLDSQADSMSDDWAFRIEPVEDAVRLGWPAVSLLRAAYLACFAFLGYPYIRQRGFMLVREAIENPSKRSFPVIAGIFGGKHYKGLGFGRLRVGPEQLGWVTQLNSYWVALPSHVPCESSISDLLLQLQGRKWSVDLQSWPSDPSFGMNSC